MTINGTEEQGASGDEAETAQLVNGIDVTQHTTPRISEHGDS